MDLTKRIRSATELPEEMLMEILARLPLKTLMSSISCVCKAWRDMITRNSYFREKYSKITKDVMVFAAHLSSDPNTYKEDEYFLINNSFRPSLSPSLKPFNVTFYGSLTGSCNGIFCLAPLGQLNGIKIYNPITREHRELPPSLLTLDSRFLGKQVLGFGFDKSSNDYKVVRIYLDNTDKCAEIYRLSTNCWTKLELQNPLPFLNQFRYSYHRSLKGVFVNGVVHWVVVPLFRIFTFDFQAEEFGEMEMGCVQLASCSSDITVPFVCSTCVSLVDDSLALVARAVDREWGVEGVDVWVMEEYGKKESWTLRYSVRLPFFDVQVPSKVATCWVNIDENQLVLLKVNGQILITCDVSYDIARIIRELAYDVHPFHHHRMSMVDGVVFQPSLVSL